MVSVAPVAPAQKMGASSEDGAAPPAGASNFREPLLFPHPPPCGQSGAFVGGASSLERRAVGAHEETAYQIAMSLIRDPWPMTRLCYALGACCLAAAKTLCLKLGDVYLGLFKILAFCSPRESLASALFMLGLCLAPVMKHVHLPTPFA